MKTLRISDELEYRLAMARWASERQDAAAAAMEKLALADAVLKATGGPLSVRAGRLETIGRPAPLRAGSVRRSRRRRA